MRWRLSLNLALSAALAAALALVVLLARRLDALGRQYQQVRILATTLHSGSVVPSFRTRTLAGDSLSIGEAEGAGTRQVLFVLTTTCPYCKAALPIWARLADSLGHLSHRRVEVIALSLDSPEATRRYAVEHHVGFAMATFPNAKLKRLYRAGAVPATVVMDHDGRVLYASLGGLDRSEVLDSIYRAATLPLPPVPPAAGTPPVPSPGR